MQNARSQTWDRAIPNTNTSWTEVWQSFGKVCKNRTERTEKDFGAQGCIVRGQGRDEFLYLKGLMKTRERDFFYR